jgi:type IV secretion system protein VirB5
MRKPIPTLLALLAMVSLAPAAHAQFAVIDIASVTQLVSQLQTLEQQLATARSELAQAQAQYQAITGNRGMEQLLSGTNRNYLPADWSTLTALPQTAGSYSALSSQVTSALTAESVLSPSQLAVLAPAAGAQLAAQRQSAAVLQGLTREALANASGRFAELQQLISTIGRATDEKAALDLQARVAAEGTMLQNEHTKLEVLYHGLEADQWASAQRSRELTIAGHGQFTARFQPSP